MIPNRKFQLLVYACRGIVQGRYYIADYAEKIKMAAMQIRSGIAYTCTFSIISNMIPYFSSPPACADKLKAGITNHIFSTIRDVRVLEYALVGLATNNGDD
jgi:hypothetical protein